MKNRTSWFDFFQTIFHQKCNIIFDIMFSSGSFRVDQKQKHDGPMMAQRWPNDSTSKAFAAIWSVLETMRMASQGIGCELLRAEPDILRIRWCLRIFSDFGECFGDFWWFVDDFGDLLMILGDLLMILGDLLMILVICWCFLCFFFMILGDLLMILAICWCFLFFLWFWVICWWFWWFVDVFCVFFLMILGDLLMILVICWCFLCFFKWFWVIVWWFLPPLPSQSLVTRGTRTGRRLEGETTQKQPTDASAPTSSKWEQYKSLDPKGSQRISR